MPLPNKKENETRENFISRCMSDEKVSKEFPDRDQKLAVCMSKACEDLSIMAQADFQYNYCKAAFIYENPKTGEMYTYDRLGDYKKDGQSLIYKGKV